MRRETKILLAILFTSLVLFAYSVSKHDFGQMRPYRELLVTESEYVQLRNERSPMQDALPPVLFVDDQELAFDQRTQKFLVSLRADGSSNPTVRVVSSLFRRYQLAIAGDLFRPDADADIGARILVYTDSEYKEFRLESTPLPVLRLHMDEPVEKDFPVGKEDLQTQLILYDNRPAPLTEERTTRARGYIRLRGASSTHYAKRQYRINLREFSIGGAETNLHLSLLGMRADDDWILSSPYNDPHKIRDTFAHRLWSESMGKNNPLAINTGIHPVHIELFINGDYRGIYSFLHPIDDLHLELFTDKSEESDFYYRSLSYAPFVESDFTDFTDSEIRGRFEIREPNPTGDPVQWRPLVSHMKSLELPSDALMDYLKEYTYLPNQIDYYLFTTLLQATDNDEKNHNYIAYREHDRHRIIESPWDLDLTLGLLWNTDYERNSFFGGDPDWNPEPRTSLITRAIRQGNREIIQAVQDRWDTLRADAWSEENLLRQVKDYEALLFDSGAVRRDRVRWPHAAYTTDLNAFGSYLRRRLTSMDAFIQSMGGEEP